MVIFGCGFEMGNRICKYCNTFHILISIFSTSMLPHTRAAPYEVPMAESLNGRLPEFKSIL